MESKKEEALVAKQHAEQRFAEKDFVGAKNLALKAQMLFPKLEGISQMVATFDIYVASESKVNGEIDFYSILGLKPSADRSMVKKHYKRLAVLLHPDKNRTAGADGAFRLVSEAWTHLSDNAKRASYDLKRNSQLSTVMVPGPPPYHDNCAKSSVPPTFWTVCTSCQVQYEYLRKYVNKRLSCKNCRSTFMAVELGTAPINGSYPVSQWSFTPENGYGGHGYNGATFYPTNTVYASGNGMPGYHSGHRSEYSSNLSFQWSTSPGTSTGYVSPNGYPAADSLYQNNGYSGKGGKKAKAPIDTTVDGSGGYNQSFGTKVTRPYKRRKVEVGGSAVNGVELGHKVVAEATMANENGSTGPKIPGSTDSSIRQPIPVIPSLIDIRNLLIEKARTEIRNKLEEIKTASADNAQKPRGIPGKPGRRLNPGISHLGPNQLGPVTLTVPDSDFHDFDKDRTEECFNPKQIWALYDEEDGMPRLYCLIRQIISTNPFKIQISYLGSKTDTEFGEVNWLCYGFTKSCGHFRATNTDIIEQVNIFSHLLSQEKAGRGGCVRIYPRRGDIWAVYRNWSSKWNRSTPYEVRHQYEMVEVLGDYSEESGVGVAPLLKLEGFKTVYQRDRNKNAIRCIPRNEMVRFSHQVPSCLLKDMSDLPEGCWDLDPAAMPEELLQPIKEAVVEEKLGEGNT